MNNQDSIIKKNVMRRVYFINTTRKFTEPRVIKLGLLFVFVAMQSLFVSIPHVISNLQTSAHSLSGAYGFMVAAFLNTQLAVQVISVAIALVAIWFVSDFVRGVTGSKMMSQGLSWNR